MWVLPDARRSVEQQAPLEVLTGREQPPRCSATPDHLPVDRGQRLGGQDHVVGGQTGRPVELQQRLRSPNMSLPNETTCPRKTLCSLARARSRPASRGAPVRVVAHDLHRHLRLTAVRVGSTDQHGRTPWAVADQVDRALHAREHLPVRPRGHVDPGHVARPGTERVVDLVPGEQLGQAEGPVLKAHHTDRPVLQARGVQPHVQRPLNVDVLVGRPALLHHDQGLGLWSEMPAQQRRQGLHLIGPRDAHQCPSGATQEADGVRGLQARGRRSIRRHLDAARRPRPRRPGATDIRTSSAPQPPAPRRLSVRNAGAARRSPWRGQSQAIPTACG